VITALAAAVMTRCAGEVSNVEVLSARDADSALLGEARPLERFGLVFRTPKDWTLNADTAPVETELSGFIVKSESIFIRDEGFGFCMVSGVRRSDGSTDPDPLKAYLDIIVERFGSGGDVSYKNLKINGLTGVMFRMTVKESIIYKFIVSSNAGLVQFDFAFPADVFDDSLLKMMRSSVSTIQESS
jgi:hypothetical protein